jgi:hypothetical protein
MSDEDIQSLIVIEDGSNANAKPLRQNFNYLDNKINEKITYVANKESMSNKGGANGYCPLDSKAQVPLSNLGNITASLLPVGAILMWGSAPIPAHFIAMTGQNDLSAYPALQELGYTSLPDTVDKVPWGSGQSGAFQTKEAGLPNIIGSFKTVCNGTKEDAFYKWKMDTNSDLADFGSGGGWAGHGKISFDASESNEIYGKSETVQPPAFTTVFIIKYE